MAGEVYECVDMDENLYDDVKPANEQQEAAENSEEYAVPLSTSTDNVHVQPQAGDARQNNDNPDYLQLQQRARKNSICLKLMSAFVVVLLLGGIGMGVFAFYGSGDGGNIGSGRDDGENISYGWSEWGSWSNCLNCQEERVRSCIVPEEHHDILDCIGPDRETRNCLTLTIGCPASVCYGPYETFTDSYRRENVTYGMNCDYSKDGRSWYRFQLSTGENGVIDHCPKMNTCGTHIPIWMNDSHPKQYGEVKEVMLGAHWGKCFQKSGSASVTKCVKDGEPFYLYQLWKSTLCASSYCTQKYKL